MIEGSGSLIPSTSSDAVTDAAGSPFKGVADLVKAHPYLFAASGLLLVGAGSYLAFKEYNKTDRVVGRFIDRCQEGGVGINAAEATVLQIWAQLGLPPSCNTPANRTFLAQKLLLIARVKEKNNQDTALKKQIAENVIHNFRTRLLEGVRRIEVDAAELEGRFAFVTPHPARIEILGDETHNHGAMPLSLSWGDGERLIYKPRSMSPEWAICADKQSNPNGSLFQRLGLPTYAVHRGEGYGYCEFLRNTPQENMHESRQSVLSLFETYWRIHGAAHSAGISDLHPENVMLQGTPRMIDLEVVGLPADPDFGTGLWGTGQSGAIRFVPGSGNRFWISDNLAARLLEDFSKLADSHPIRRKVGKSRFNSPEQLQNELLQHGLTTRVQCYLGEKFIRTLGEFGAKRSLPKRLSSQELTQLGVGNRNRIVVVETAWLANMIGKSPEEGWQSFHTAVTQGLEAWEFTIDQGALEASREQFMEDMSNNDVPIFFYDRIHHEVYYGEHRIGYRQQVAGTSSSH